ncbi:MAG: hypothetical protein Kow00124_03690 [Anaerolineae bacterium]
MDMIPEDASDVSRPEHCDVCHIGTLHPRRTTYTRWMDGRLIIVPNIAIFVCDMCGEVTTDDESIRLLEDLLGAEDEVIHGDERPVEAFDPTLVISPNRRGSV